MEEERRADRDNRVIGEALTILFSFFDNFIASPQSGNLDAVRYIKKHYPSAISYVDRHHFTPLHGACSALNMNMFRFFVEWHLEQNPLQRGGLYDMNSSGITPLDTLIDTQQNITPTLIWLRKRGLLTSRDVDKWLLVHRAAHSSSISTIGFFLDLLPSAVLSKDGDDNLPIHLFLGLRFRPRGSFSDEDFAILRLLISQGISYGGINSIGGLFDEDPAEEGQDESSCCTLTTLLREVGENNAERVWEVVSDCVAEAGDYTDAPILHAAIRGYKQCVSHELLLQVLGRFGAEGRDEHGELPLHFAVREGVRWEEGLSDIVEANVEALKEVDEETNLPFLPFAALNGADLSDLYHLVRQKNLLDDVYLASEVK